jgi:hypothetical protein
MAQSQERTGGSTHSDDVIPAAATSPPQRQTSQAVAYLAIAALLIACVLGLIWFFLSERIPDLTEKSLTAAEQRWEKNRPASYDMHVTIRGTEPGQVQLEVRDGQPTAMSRDGNIPPERTWDVWTVPGQFKMLDQEMAIAADPNHKGQGPPGAQVWLRCDFDPKYGYPRIFHRVITGGGPEVFWQVTKFEPK